MTNAVAAAHYFGFALVLAFLKSGLGHLSSVQSVELKSLLLPEEEFLFFEIDLPPGEQLILGANR